MIIVIEVKKLNRGYLVTAAKDYRPGHAPLNYAGAFEDVGDVGTAAHEQLSECLVEVIKHDGEFGKE